MIKFGRYDQRISFVSLGQVEDGYGGYTPTPFVELNTYASVMQLKGSNDLESAQLELPKTYRIRIQNRANFTPNTTHFIVYRGFYLAIKSIEEYRERLSREYIITAIDTGNEFEEIPTSGIGVMTIGSTFIVA